MPWGPTTATAAFGAGQRSIASRARTARDTTGEVERVNISSGSPYEPIVGFCRAVRIGDRIFVAGTAPVMPDGSDPPADSYEQARRCSEIIAAALTEAGASLLDVVRTRTYLAHQSHFDGYARAHGEAFANVRPANTTVVAQLLDDRWLLEMEAEAVVGARPDVRGPA
jgi:enamine deaminase RidA (YjgF/YER057c/UK114 family)